MAKDDSARRRSARGKDRDDEDRPRRRPRDEEDDDEAEDERPRRRRARDEEEVDERPRKRKPRRDEEDEDEPRRKRRPRDDDDEDDSDDGEDDEDKPRKSATRKKWEKVHLGLGFSIANAAMLLGAMGCVILAVALIILAGILSWDGLVSISNMLMMVGGVLYLGMEIPAVVSYSLCLNTPNKRGTLPLAIISLVIAVIKVVSLIILFVLPILDQGVTSANIGAIGAAGWIVFILGDVEWIIFPFYMKAAMLILRDKYLSESTNIPIALACGVIGFKIVLAFVVSVKNVRGEGGASMIGTILGAVVFVVMLFFALTYLKAIIAVRKRVATKLPPPSDDMP